MNTRQLQSHRAQQRHIREWDRYWEKEREKAFQIRNMKFRVNVGTATEKQYFDLLHLLWPGLKKR